MSDPGRPFVVDADGHVMEPPALWDQIVIDELISWSEQDAKLISKVIIAGGTRIGGILALMLVTADMRVSLIEPDAMEAERLSDLLGTSVLIIQGESTDLSVLEQAGIEHCDASDH